MPIRLNAAELIPGMILHDPIRRGSTTLLGAGHSLVASGIATLLERYPALTVRVRCHADESDARVDDDRDDRAIIDTALDRITECVADVFDQAADSSELVNGFGRVERQVASVISYLVAHPVRRLTFGPDLGAGHYLQVHVAKVFVSAIVLAMRMGQYVLTERHRQSGSTNLSQQLVTALLPLGVGILYMDLGMLDLLDLVERREPLTPMERARIEKHPLTSVANSPPQMSAAGRAVVRGHHERMDQCGYPDRVPGNRLHVLTRVARVADAFTAATAPRAYRPARSTARALWEMCIGLDRVQFDPLLANGLAALVQPFATGSRVKLNSGRSGVVVSATDDAFRPKVAITQDALGMDALTSDTLDVVDLSHDPSLHVVYADGEDVSDLRPGLQRADAPRRVA